MAKLFKVSFRFWNQETSSVVVPELVPTRRGFLVHLAVRGLQAADLQNKL